MHAYPIAPAVSADDVDDWFRATGELRSAIAIVEDAAAAFLGLVHDTGWEARGVRTLHDALETSRWDAAHTAGMLQARLAELDRVGVL